MKKGKLVRLEFNPTLESVLMVEDLIKDTSGTYTKYQLWKRLPKKMMYQTFSVIISYLVESGKLGIDNERKIGWIYNPALVRKYLKRKDLSWKNETSIQNKVRGRKSKASVRRTKNTKRVRMALPCIKPITA